MEIKKLLIPVCAFHSGSSKLVGLNLIRMTKNMEKNRDNFKNTILYKPL